MKTDKHRVIPRVSCFIFHKDELLLMRVNPKSKKPYAGNYFPIGGHIEKGESVTEAARREIEEESGFVLENPLLRGVIHQTGFYGQDIMWFFTENRLKDKKIIKESEEGSLHWVKLSETGKYKLPENVPIVIDKMSKMKDDQIIIGSNQFDGKDKLISFDVTIN